MTASRERAGDRSGRVRGLARLPARLRAGGTARETTRSGGRPRSLTLERLEVHPNCLRWPARLARQLGRLPDRALAKLAGVSLDAVQAERRRRGIPVFRRLRKPIQWTAAMIRLLGTDTDQNVALVLGLRKGDVFRKRNLLRIDSYARATFRPPGFHWSARALSLLGTASDREIAGRLKGSQGAVSRKRWQLEIPSHHRRPAPVVWTAPMLRLLGKVTDIEMHRRFGTGMNAVRIKRRQLGIPPTFLARAVARTAALVRLLKLTNRELRSRFGVGATTLRILRQEYGIPAPSRRNFRWTRDRLARLGRESDERVALAMGLGKSAVSYKRRSLGTAALYPKRRWTRAECKLLGRHLDAVVARRLGRSLVAVQLKRRQLKIPRLRAGRRGL